jgi:hypothetical protein
VLWIRIRNNPNFLAGSESESEKKVRIRIRIRIQTVLQDENFCEKSKIKHLKEKNLMFFYSKFFFSDVQVSEHIWKHLEATFRKIWGQNISLRIRIRIRIRKKWFVDPNPNPKKMSSDPQHWSTPQRIECGLGYRYTSENRIRIRSHLSATQIQIKMHLGKSNPDPESPQQSEFGSDTPQQ